MKVVTKAALAGALALASALPAQADVIRLDAKSSMSEYSDFSITYNDTDADGLFSLSELITFSGITLTASSSTVFFFDKITMVAPIAGFTVGSAPLFTSWNFANPSAFAGVDPSIFAYSETVLPPDTGTVPEPGSLALAALAFAAAGYIARRKRD